MNRLKLPPFICLGAGINKLEQVISVTHHLHLRKRMIESYSHNSSPKRHSRNGVRKERKSLSHKVAANHCAHQCRFCQFVHWSGFYIEIGAGKLRIFHTRILQIFLFHCNLQKKHCAWLRIKEVLAWSVFAHVQTQEPPRVIV